MTRQRNARSRFGGYLMFDLIIVLSLTIVVLSTTSIWVYKTMHYATKVKQRDQHARNISRIGRQMRIDAFDSDSVTVDGKVLTITTKNQRRIEYSIGENSINRTESGGKQTHRDDFEFANNAVIQWNTELTDSVSLDVRRDFSSHSTSKDQKRKGLDAQIRITLPGEDSK